MGEVVLARDPDVGRDVAVKRIRGDADESATARFLREARIQARLEHPAIVPVYEIGRDDDGKPYFAMKRLSGSTLAELMRAAPSRQKLLRAFLEICRAVAFAHSRGVIHRDLKPANIAAGEHGEIYVLDWGLARIIDEDEAETRAAASSFDLATRADSMLGTPGYMAPEQVIDARSVGKPADVYGLGAILFEILAGEPLHPRSLEALDTTTTGIDGSPARRKPDLDVPPELDAACVAALAMAPAARPTADDLADRVERYLDGDRDLERRRMLAAEHVSAARAAFAGARRAEAARAAARALALEPESADAAAIMNRLLFEQPAKMPPELDAVLAASARAATRRQARFALTTYGALVAFMLIGIFVGVTSWGWWIAIMGLTAMLGGASFVISRRAATTRMMWMMVLGNIVAGAMGSRFFGPLILTPIVLSIQVLSFTQYPQLMHRARTLIALVVASWLAPIALESAHILPRTWSVGLGTIDSRSSVIVLGGAGTAILLVCLHGTMLVVTGMFASALAVSRAKALRDTEIREWHLRQLMPDATDATASP
jgi:serine/threonine-protein kinase